MLHSVHIAPQIAESKQSYLHVQHESYRSSSLALAEEMETATVE